jgi:hypothetical protein
VPKSWRVAESGGQATVLQQLPNQVLNNSMGVVHGEASAASSRCTPHRCVAIDARVTAYLS